MDHNLTQGRILAKGFPNKQLANDDDTDISKGKAYVEIAASVRFQKFRYQDEGRPGKKYQEKDFITLKLHHLKGRVVRVVIVCTDAGNHELIHPNGLVGVSCHDGIYDCKYGITRESFEIKIPFIRIFRMKTKKNAHLNIPPILNGRASHLPSPYRERCQSQCSEMSESSPHDFDTNKVCLGVIVTEENNYGNVNGTLHAISPAIANASQKTNLDIRKLSTVNVPALTGDCINIFTTENSPKIEPDNYLVYVTYDSNRLHWESDKYSPTDEDILYKKVISYQVPRFEPKPDLEFKITANLHLTCPRSNLHCTCEFYYMPKKENIPTKRMYIETKGSCSEQDIKLQFKRLKTEYNGKSSDDIKACLLTKVEPLSNSQHEPEEIFADDLHENDSLIFLGEHMQNQTYSQEHSVHDHHQDPLPEETSFQLDTITNKCDESSSCNNEAITTVNDGNQLIFRGVENSLPGTGQESNVLKYMESSSHNLNVTAKEPSIPGQTNILWICSADGTATGQIDASAMQQFLSQTFNYDE